jgi:glycosyltransferase involved in cell wall biosynthesis
VVPNGADTAAYRPVDSQTRAEWKRKLGLSGKPVVLFVAADVPPNRVGLRWVKDVARLASGFTFLIVGPVVSRPYTEDNVIATGCVDDYVSYQMAAEFAICPIEHGGGTKIKLLESLAAGLPTVAFAESIHGTTLRPDEHLLVVEKNSRALLEGLTCLDSDRDAASRLGEAARRHIVAHYDWSLSGQTLEEALMRLTSIS